jgi:protein-L-isoaspartate O-methyltransferase
MEDLRALAERGNESDRAFVDASLRMAWARTPDGVERRALEEIHTSLKEAARRAHAPLREAIASGVMGGAALRRLFDGRTALERDHFVEEVLGVAYPPLEERALGRELVTYTPSGFEEIVHAFEVAKLGPDDRFLDVGAGLGKVVLLASLLTGASCTGLECEEVLVNHARAASAELGASRVRFELGDARSADLPRSDVVFMYVPFTGETFATVMARIGTMSPRLLCCAPLDLVRHPGFEPVGAPCSWLQVYARR